MEGADAPPPRLVQRNCLLQMFLGLGQLSELKQDHHFAGIRSDKNAREVTCE
jgi:hypothetical protein